MWPDERSRHVWYDAATRLVDGYTEGVERLPVRANLDERQLERWLAGFDFERPVEPDRLIRECGEWLSRGIVHMAHPRYFGFFNPSPTFAGVIGDLLTAAFNPQLAVREHAPAPVAIERHVLDFFGRRLGLPDADGSFTTGGAEANLSAVLVALARHFPEAGTEGLASLPRRPTIYASAEAHHALMKIAHTVGLGRSAVHLVPVDSKLRLDVEALRTAVRRDRDQGDAPFLVVATAGTTAAGVIDPLPEIAALCRAEGLDMHVDAAWAGAACLSPRLRPLLAGVESADSVTVDAHKWLSVPMGAGMFLTPHRTALREAFRVVTGYMPSAEADDPYLTSIQWSRRFIGLKVFASLAAIGVDGYAREIDRQAELGDSLRNRLQDAGWVVVNDTPLPVVCFAEQEEGHAGEDTDRRLRAIAAHVVESGEAWIAVVSVAERPALRACITSYRTTEDDLGVLCEALDVARARTHRTPFSG